MTMDGSTAGWLVDDRSRLDGTEPYWKSERMNQRRVHTHDARKSLSILNLGEEHDRKDGCWTCLARLTCVAAFSPPEYCTAYEMEVMCDEKDRV